MHLGHKCACICFVYALCMPVCLQKMLSFKIFWAFVFGRCLQKKYLCFLSLIYFAYVNSISKSSKIIITEWLWNMSKPRYQNGPVSVKWKHHFLFIFCILRLSNKHIYFDTWRWTPCMLPTAFSATESYCGRVILRKYILL